MSTLHYTTEAWGLPVRTGSASRFACAPDAACEEKTKTGITSVSGDPPVPVLRNLSSTAWRPAPYGVATHSTRISFEVSLLTFLMVTSTVCGPISPVGTLSSQTRPTVHPG